MRRLMIAVFGCALLLGVPRSYGQMPDMEKHMKDHMGGGGMGGAAEGKKESQAQNGLVKQAEQAGVTVKVTYMNPGKNWPMFNVALDTHSVYLEGYKFDEIVALRDDKGNVYKPKAASEEGSGHHREAALEFKDVDISGAKYFEVAVKGVAGVDERVFRFDIQKDMK